MNPHIELVKKWLANPESVSRKELFKNKESASFAADDVYLTPACTAADAAYLGRLLGVPLALMPSLFEC